MGFVCSLLVMVNDTEYHFKSRFYICGYTYKLLTQKQAKAEYCVVILENWEEAAGRQRRDSRLCPCGEREKGQKPAGGKAS